MTVEYIVQAGDRPIDIAKLLRVPVESIPNILYVGDKILITIGVKRAKKA